MSTATVRPWMKSYAKRKVVLTCVKRAVFIAMELPKSTAELWELVTGCPLVKGYEKLPEK